LSDNPIIPVAKVLPKGAVQLPPEVRERPGLKPGTKLKVATAEGAVSLQASPPTSTHISQTMGLAYSPWVELLSLILWV
jgi:bifunctional DNA-binding transcriptional regulator/antitoxin component of YhaV-PrlF toxin-antitoxin module